MTVPKATASVLCQTFIAADQLRRKALETGATKEQANDIVAQALQQAWPRGREEPWHYLCETCSDSGWRVYQCPGDASCGRKNPHLAHEYVTTCWCPKGAALKVKPRGEEDELAKVGKTVKPSRFGR